MYITAGWYQWFYFRLSCKSTLGLFRSQAEGVFGGEQAYKTITAFHVYVYLSAQVSSFATPSCFYSNEGFCSDHCITPARTRSPHCHYISLRDSAIFKKCIIGLTVSFQRDAKVAAVTCQLSFEWQLCFLEQQATRKKFKQNVRESFVCFLWLYAIKVQCNDLDRSVSNATSL